jgi:glycosyltransferase involved in cell wall biosynthesis
MRILHLSDHYAPVLGGIETHVAALARQQALRGDRVTVLTSTPATADGRHCDDAGPVTVRRVGSVRAGLATDVRTYDLVHVHVSVVAPFSAPVAAVLARRGVPTVVTVHSLWGGMGPVPGVAAGLVGLRSAPVSWTAVSLVAAEQLRAQLPPGTAVEVLPNAVDVPARRSTPERPPGEAVRLVSTMRLARRKRPTPLLRMFDGVRRAVDRPVRLTVVGDGPLRAGFERRVRRAGLQDLVTVTGRVEPLEVHRALAESDVYVAPAVLESFGLAALEARSVGLPVVGHAASGMADFIDHGVDGLLCADDRAMVGALVDLVASPALCRRIAEHNRVVSPAMTWEHTLRCHEAAYAGAVALTRHPRGSFVGLGER